MKIKKSKKSKKKKSLRLGEFLRRCNLYMNDRVMIHFVEYSKDAGSYYHTVRTMSFDGWQDIPQKFMAYKIREIELGLVSVWPVQKVDCDIMCEPLKHEPMYNIYLSCSPKAAKRLVK